MRRLFNEDGSINIQEVMKETIGKKLSRMEFADLKNMRDYLNNLLWEVERGCYLQFEEMNTEKYWNDRKRLLAELDKEMNLRTIRLVELNEQDNEHTD